MLKNKKIVRFLFISILIYIIWTVIYDLWIKPTNLLDNYLTNLLAVHTAFILNHVGYNVFHLLKAGKHFISRSGHNILLIANPCNGLVLYPLYIGFIIAIPGRVMDMIKMILIGCIIIYLVNLIRAVALCIVQIHTPQYLEFNHKYTFSIIVYGVIFLLWVFWISNYSYLKSPIAKVNE